MSYALSRYANYKQKQRLKKQKTEKYTQKSAPTQNEFVSAPTKNLTTDTFSADLGDTRQSFSEFLKQIREKIKRAQRYPPSVRSVPDGAETVVRFTIRRNGTVADAKIVGSSGSRSLDNVALAAIRNAVPFPPFPNDQKGNLLHVELPIQFQLKT